MMTMGLCLMATTVMGQKGAGLSTMEEGRQGGVYRTKARTMEIHAEVVARQQSNTTLVRFIADESYKMLTRDQDVIKSVEAASNVSPLYRKSGLIWLWMVGPLEELGRSVFCW